MWKTRLPPWRLAHLCGVTDEELKAGLACFKGSKRRFDFRVRRDDFVYIDDYAHHPEELRASIRSIKELYPGKQVTGIFQPHLFSRTRDFADEFAEVLIGTRRFDPFGHLSGARIAHSRGDFGDDSWQKVTSSL